MTQSMPTNFRLQGALRQRGAIVLSTTAMVLLFQVSCMDFGRVEITEESFANGDAYTWSALVDGWRVSGQWHPIVPAHNAPYGLETHPTMPSCCTTTAAARGTCSRAADRGARTTRPSSSRRTAPWSGGSSATAASRAWTPRRRRPLVARCRTVHAEVLSELR